MEQEIAIFLYDKSTVMAQPWADAGYLCYCVDIQHKAGSWRRDNIILEGADMRHWIPPQGRVVFFAAFPPCTHIAVSGARWFKDKGLFRLAESIELFAYAQKWAEFLGAPYLIENPISTISSYYRKPDYTFDPCDYGDPWTKRTCLWTGNGFVMPPKKRVEPLQGSRAHKMPPSTNRADLRSVTPPGFAAAVFRANAPDKLREVV